jgi:hypothetical protein
MASYKEEELGYEYTFGKFVRKNIGRSVGWIIFTGLLTLAVINERSKKNDVQNNLEKTVTSDTTIPPIPLVSRGNVTYFNYQNFYNSNDSISYK